jgi:DNA repair exonuclease SbcCD nuclease subunit
VEYSFQRKDRCVATIRGQSYRSGQNFRPADFSIRGEGAARIAVAFAPEIEPRNLRGQSVDYWALGGRHQATDLVQEAGVARYCGSPQGFCPDEPGPHSCTLVQIEHGRAHLKAIETDVVRWRKERIELAADADRRDLTQAIRHRLGELRPDRGELLTLVRWTVACDGSLGHELRNDHVCDAVLASLADAPGNAEMVSILIEPESRVISNDRFEEETILGDFLRKVRELEQDPNRVIDLIEYLPDTPGKQELASLVKLSSPSKRQHIFERVMSLGMDLLATDCEGTKA